jgi:hypothetical protein
VLDKSGAREKKTAETKKIKVSSFIRPSNYTCGLFQCLRRKNWFFFLNKTSLIIHNFPSRDKPDSSSFTIFCVFFNSLLWDLSLCHFKLQIVNLAAQGTNCDTCKKMKTNIFFAKYISKKQTNIPSWFMTNHKAIVNARFRDQILNDNSKFSN